MDDDAGRSNRSPTTGSVRCASLAHPDDLEYGAASAVAAWTTAGKDVAYALVTSGEAGIDGLAPEECGPQRRSEEIAGAAAVGVETVEFLGHPDGIVEYGLPLRRDLARAVRRHRPRSSSPSLRPTGRGPSARSRRLNMADHRNVGIAVLDACRDAGNRWIFPELLDEGHEPWSGVRLVAVAASSRVEPRRRRHRLAGPGHRLPRGPRGLPARPRRRRPATRRLPPRAGGAARARASTAASSRPSS